MYLQRASWNSSANLTEVFLCFFLSCTANVRVKTHTIGARSPLIFQNFCVVLRIVCLCVKVYCTIVNWWLPNYS